jgi:hypothetical protein
MDSSMRSRLSLSLHEIGGRVSYWVEMRSSAKIQRRERWSTGHPPWRGTLGGALDRDEGD